MDTLIQKIESQLSIQEIEQAKRINEAVQAQYLTNGAMAPLRMLAFDRT